MITFVFEKERITTNLHVFMRSPSQEAIPLSTPVGCTKLLKPIDTDGDILMMGSCFAEHIGHQLEEFLFPVILNPMGIQYNPLSIAKALEQIMDERVYTEADLIEHQGRYHSLMHHGDFSHPDAQVVLERIRLQMDRTYEALPKMKHVIFTFGTAYVYEEKKTNEIVSNCHKLPASQFSRRRLLVPEIVDVYEKLLNRLLQVNSQLQVVFTVSPVRHLRDGAHDNQLSKSTLLLAIEELTTRYSNRVHYFPAYEILLDELRDYRFFNADMTHPSPVAVEIVWCKFQQACISEHVYDYMHQWQKILKQLGHRPIQPGSEAHRKFLQQVRSKIEKLQTQYPRLDFRKALALCSIP